jgi:hypothetical protein
MQTVDETQEILFRTVASGCKAIESTVHSDALIVAA